MAIKFKITNSTYFAEGTSATIKCNGKKLASDIMIEAVEVSEKTEAIVTITNTSTSYSTKYNYDGLGEQGIISPNSTVTITIPIGITLWLLGPVNNVGIPVWETTSITGDIEATNTSYQKSFLINGDGTITGYAYDAD